MWTVNSTSSSIAQLSPSLFFYILITWCHIWQIWTMFDAVTIMVKGCSLQKVFFLCFWFCFHCCGNFQSYRMSLIMTSSFWSLLCFNLTCTLLSLSCILYPRTTWSLFLENSLPIFKSKSDLALYIRHYLLVLMDYFQFAKETVYHQKKRDCVNRSTESEKVKKINRVGKSKNDRRKTELSTWSINTIVKLPSPTPCVSLNYSELFK